MRPNEISIAWLISAYQKPQQLIHILERIAGPHDSVWLHYDRKSPAAELRQLRAHFRGDRRMHFFSQYSVYWGGIQSVWVDDYLGRRLLQSAAHFDYVVHFTGTTYPIKSDQALRQHLATHYGTTFLLLDPAEPVDEQGSPRSQFFAKEHFGVTPGRNIPKYPLWWRIRFKLNLKWLRVLRRLGWHRGACQLPRAFAGIYRGYVQNVIFREHYLAGLADPRAAQLLGQLQYVSSPDEVFFNTILANTVPPEHLVTDDNLLLTFWRQQAASLDTLKEADLGALLDSPHFFARKFESLELLRQVDRRLAGL